MNHGEHRSYDYDYQCHYYDHDQLPNSSALFLLFKQFKDSVVPSVAQLHWNRFRWPEKALNQPLGSYAFFAFFLVSNITSRIRAKRAKRALRPAPTNPLSYFTEDNLPSSWQRSQPCSVLKNRVIIIRPKLSWSYLTGVSSPASCSALGWSSRSFLVLNLGSSRFIRPSSVMPNRVRDTKDIPFKILTKSRGSRYTVSTGHELSLPTTIIILFRAAQSVTK